MEDDLRDEENSSAFLDELEEEEDFLDLDDAKNSKSVPRSSGSQLFGMTPAQRMVISLMILFMVCLLGSLFLLITGKVAPPI